MGASIINSFAEFQAVGIILYLTIEKCFKIFKFMETKIVIRPTLLS